MTATSDADGSHLAGLAGGWSVWRWVAVRGAGFPAARIQDLASPPTIAAIDSLLSAEDAEAAVRAQAIVELKRVLEPLVGDARKPIGKALRKLGAGHVPDIDHPAIEPLAAAHAALAAARDAAAACLAEETGRLGRVLREIAGEPLFREACLWQNRAVVHTAIDHVRDARASQPKKQRYHEAVVARYLQRYCTKNETIGFFGPLGWATLDPTDASAVLRPGAQLLGRRTVYFEFWPILALADLIAADPELRPQLPPRRNASVALAALPPEVAKIVELCDGVRSAREVAALLVADESHELADEGEAYALLESLVDKRVIWWRLELPYDVDEPERALRDALAALHGTTRDRILAVLDELEQRRADVAAAAGDPETLDRALGELDAAFESATGLGAVRRRGEHYAGRTLVYEECQRDIELRLGPSALAPHAPALALLLDTARWFTYELASDLRGQLQRAHAELGGTKIELARMLERIPALTTGMPDVVERVLAEVDRRWRHLLAIPEDAALVERSSAELAAGHRAAFTAPQPGWPGARHHSIDLMIAARSFDAVRRGDALAVIGEVDAGGTQLMAPVLQRGSPNRSDLVRAYRAGVATEQQVEIPISREHATRPICGPGAPAAYTLDVGMQRRASSPATRIAPADLVVERIEGRLSVCTRDGRTRLDATAFCATFLSDATANKFTILQPAHHLPRIVIDRLVVHRQTWLLAPGELGFANMRRGVDRLAAARRWARGLALPRWCFVKIPEENKPIFLDLENPYSIDLLASLAERGSRIALSEMVPCFDELWLPDAADNRYTCELRMAAVDPVPWRPLA